MSCGGSISHYKQKHCLRHDERGTTTILKKAYRGYRQRCKEKKNSYAKSVTLPVILYECRNINSNKILFLLDCIAPSAPSGKAFRQFVCFYLCIVTLYVLVFVFELKNHYLIHIFMYLSTFPSSYLSVYSSLLVTVYILICIKFLVVSSYVS